MMIKKIGTIKASHVFRVVPVIILAILMVMVLDFFIISNKIKKAVIISLPGHENVSASTKTGQ